jgi:hypothetical protein
LRKTRKARSFFFSLAPLAANAATFQLEVYV